MFHVKRADVTTRVPPHAFFFVSAVFHYLGPAFAVLLFSSVPVLGVAWFRIASAAVVFAMWRSPYGKGRLASPGRDARATNGSESGRAWRLLMGQPWVKLRVLLALGIVLGLMNASFYLAIACLPLGTVGAIEFLGPITLAALGARTRRNIAALVFAAAGGLLLADVRFGGEPLGFVFAIANCALFMLYVVLGHRIAQEGGAGARATNGSESAGARHPQAPAAKGAAGIDRLGAAMLVALVTITPIGLTGALPAMTHPLLILAGIGVGICSSVIPYVCDQLAMARLPRATFALLLSLLPASAAVIGVVVLRQIPTPVEIAGILLVAGGVALHQEAEARPGERTKGRT